MPGQQELAGWLRAQGGTCHTTVAQSAGFSKHHIAAAVATDSVQRVRRSWLVEIGADPRRRIAASVSGRLTCLSAAQLHGLWTPAHEGVHVFVPSSASRLDSSGLRIHCAIAPVPVARTAPEHPIINVLFHVARCASRVDALAVWESALRLRLVDAAVLKRVRWRSTRAVQLADAAAALSDSGVETHFRELMVSIGVRVRQQVWVDGHPLDGLIGDTLAVQIDGFEHHSKPRDRRRDMRADARLALRGYTVLRFDYH